MGDIENIVFGEETELKAKSKMAKQASTIPPTETGAEAIYPAETLIEGAKLWFGKSRPRVAATLKKHGAVAATKKEVEKWLKG